MLIVKLRSCKLSASLLSFQAFALPVTIFKTEAIEQRQYLREWSLKNILFLFLLMLALT